MFYTICLEYKDEIWFPSYFGQTGGNTYSIVCDTSKWLNKLKLKHINIAIYYVSYNIGQILENNFFF